MADDIAIHLTLAQRQQLDQVTAATGLTVDELVSSQIARRFQRNHGAKAGAVIDMAPHRERKRRRTDGRY